MQNKKISKNVAKMQYFLLTNSDIGVKIMSKVARMQQEMRVLK